MYVYESALISLGRGNSVRKVAIAWLSKHLLPPKWALAPCEETFTPRTLPCRDRLDPKGSPKAQQLSELDGYTYKASHSIFGLLGKRYT